MPAFSLMRRALTHQREMASPKIPDAPACRAHQATKRFPRLLCYSAQNEKTKFAKMMNKMRTRCLAHASLKDQAFLALRQLHSLRSNGAEDRVRLVVVLTWCERAIGTWG